MSEKSLMKLASDLGVSFSAAKIISNHVRAEYDAQILAADMGMKFVEHIQSHLQSGQEVICKICGKSVKAIADYEGEKEEK